MSTKTSELQSELQSHNLKKKVRQRGFADPRALYGCARCSLQGSDVAGERGLLTDRGERSFVLT